MRVCVDAKCTGDAQPVSEPVVQTQVDTMINNDGETQEFDFSGPTTACEDMGYGASEI
jgi:hypothetical protein